MQRNLPRLPHVVLMLLLAGTIVTLSGCHGIPQGTAPTVTVSGAVALRATGAGLITADAQKTSFKIKCALCGYESEVVTIDTPTPDKPYTLDWVCPKCGHKQKITLRAVAASPLLAK